LTVVLDSLLLEETRPRSKNVGSQAVLTIIVEPAPKGRHHAYLNGRLLCTSAAPFCESARILLAEGIDPATPLEMKHAGRDLVILSATVGTAARLTVSNDHFVKWRPGGGD
jgi:hypothetical protein